MIFHSADFLFFFGIVLLGFHVLRAWSARKRWLLGASWAFYASWSPRFLLLLIATTAIDFWLARAIFVARAAGDKPHGPPPRRARRLLWVSLAINLGVLAFFKYGGFFYASIAELARLGESPGWLAFAVPLGISFYTFHSISYVVDTYRGVRPPAERFSDFALYVAFFPQLIAGPITRWGYFGPQLERPRRVRFTEVESALFLIAIGLVKKVVLADPLGAQVDAVYASPLQASPLEAWTGLYAYAFQIYFDFSGYTDIAMGLAGLLGFRLPENFRHPYLAVDPSEFWRRWHITLSTWLRDYLFIPIARHVLRRSGAPKRAAVIATVATMTLAGLWHGAAWTFVLWGAYHGIWLVAHRLLTWRGGPRPVFPMWLPDQAAAAPAAAPRTPPWLRRLATFHLVAIGLVLFRAGSLAVAGQFARALIASHLPTVNPPVVALAIIAFGILTHAAALRIDVGTLWQRVPRVARGAALAAASIAIWLCGAQSAHFIYFQF